MIISCSYVLYEYLLKLKNVLGLVLGLVILSSASSSGVWPRSTSLVFNTPSIRVAYAYRHVADCMSLSRTKTRHHWEFYAFITVV